MYKLGEPYSKAYLTEREVDTLRLLIKGCTIKQTACQLGLSPRTVEYYVRNMRLKLNCDNKRELIKAVLKTELGNQLFHVNTEIT